LNQSCAKFIRSRNSVGSLVLNNQVGSTAPALTSSVELHATPNGTLASVTDAQEYISGGEGNNSGSSSTPVDSKVEGGDADKENVDVSTKILSKAMTEEEVLPE
jgi:hypothetical protein